MPKVESSVISEIDHEAGSMELTVTFRSGKRYLYFMVPRHVYERFLAAESKGDFLNTVIKPTYPVREIA